MNIIKEFLLYRKSINTFNKIELTNSEKIQLESYDRDLLKTIATKVNDNLVKLILTEDVSREYAIGYKQAIAHQLSYFKKYNTK